MHFNHSNNLISAAALLGSSMSSGHGPSSKGMENMHENMLGWNVPAEHMELVHPYWRGFVAPAKYWHMMLALIYFMIMCTSLIGNGCVVYIFGTSKSLKSPSNLFIINLALFDLTMTVDHGMLICNSFLEHMIGWQVGCDIYGIFGSLAGIGGAMTNAAIAYDRYRTITSPIDGRLNFKQAYVIILFTWFWSMPFVILPYLQIWGKFTTEGFLTTCSFDFLTEDEDTKVFVAAIFIWSYCIPLLLIILFYSKLMSSVKAHERMLKEQAKKMNVKSLVSNQDKERSVEMKIAKVAFTIFFLFLCSWTPYAVVAVLGAFGYRDSITPFNSMIPAVCAKLVSAADPWVYAINHPRYRLELSKRCKWMGIQETDTTSHTQSDTTSVVTEKITDSA